MDRLSKEVPRDDLAVRETEAAEDISIHRVIGRFLLLLFVGSMALYAGALLQMHFYITSSLPSLDKLKHYAPGIVSCVYDDRGKVIADFAYQRRFVVPIRQIPWQLQAAFVAAEDKDYWKRFHRPSIKDSWPFFWMSFPFRRVRLGGFTISMQVATNVLLPIENKVHRRIRHHVLNWCIERRLTQDEILSLYLNEIYLGSGAYGVEAAARTYFGKHIGELSLAECAMIAGLAKSPGWHSPRHNMQKALERRAYVLKRMLEDRYITRKQYEQALNEAVTLAPKEPPYPREAGDFVEHVRRYVVQKYGSDTLHKEGLQIYTTCNVDMTRAALEAVDKGVGRLDKRQGYRGPIKQLTGPQIAEFIQHKTDSPAKPPAVGDITDGVITRIGGDSIYVSLGRYTSGSVETECLGEIPIDANPTWWCRKPYMRPEKRTRNFGRGDVPFEVGDLIRVRLVKQLGENEALQGKDRLATPVQDAACATSRFSLELEQEPLVQGALMMRENRSGYIRVLIGGHSGSSSEYNRATQSRRQAGSTFKPVVYAAALKQGLSRDDVILQHTDAGPVTMREALVHSMNVPTIKILQDIGLDRAKACARKLGYTCALPEDTSLALGNVEVSLEEQVNTYSVYANNGYVVPGVYIRKIVDRHGRILEEHLPPVFSEEPVESDTSTVQPATFTGSGTPRQSANIAARPAGIAHRVMDEATALTMTDMLRGVVQEGTAKGLKNIVDRPDIAGKTGTSKGYVNAWFVGYTPAYTAGVWVGFDDNVSIGDDETGGKVAAPIWGGFMKHVLKDEP